MSFYDVAWDQPYLTPSIAKVLLSGCPAKARWACPYYVTPEGQATAAQETGTILDLMLLGQDHRYFRVLPHDEFRSKEARQERDAAYEKGFIPIKQKDWAAYQEMHDAVLASMPDGARDVLSTGVVQERIFWGSEPPCSTEPDAYRRDVVMDLKVLTQASAAPGAWQRHVARYDMELQVAATLEATGATEFWWLVCEAWPPYTVALHRASPMFKQFAAQRWERAKRLWWQHVQANDWPSYPSAEIDPPTWKLNIEAEAAEETAASPTGEPRDPAMLIQAG